MIEHKRKRRSTYSLRPRNWNLAPISVAGRKGWRLGQRSESIQSKAHEKGPREFTQVVGWKADILLPVVVDCVSRSGHKPSAIACRKQPFHIPETEGYRLAIAFKLSKRTDSSRQVERISRAVRLFEEEEAYLWYSYLLRAGRYGNETKLASALANLGEVVGE